MVNGVVNAITAAHTNLAPAKASLAVGELRNSSINRSPSAYLLNPEAERALYTGDTDLNMTVLRIDSAADKALGMFAWFAVHPTSMNNTNLLVSGDNKGYASYMVERMHNGATSAGARPGAGPFVAAFGATNLGDVSPNILGPHCRDTGLPCDFDHSTCNNRTELCSAFGPGVDMFDSTEIIGQRQVDSATALFETTKDLGGGIDFKHAYVKMPGLAVTDPVTGAPAGTLCSAAMGDSFAAGTIDG
jgi:neutral ceramidase